MQSNAMRLYLATGGYELHPKTEVHEVFHIWRNALQVAGMADIATYPEEISKRLEGGAWVSALKDGKEVTLVRDESHERTASKDIEIVMPKQLTPTNMQILKQYSTYSAS